jgi:alpha-tubulin suppressor-like RCC1 family protein
MQCIQADSKTRAAHLFLRAGVFILTFILLSGEAWAQTAATPVFSPTAGTSATQFNVTLTDSTAGATIYYTADGSTPTISSLSVTPGGTILVAKSETLNAMAVASGYTNSAVASSSYEITGQVSAGSYHTLALRSDGTVWVYGLNSSGQLGDGTETSRTTPEQLTSLSGIVEVAAQTYSSVALKSDGTVWAWGLNTNGQIGDNTTSTRYSPVEVKKSNGAGGTTNLTNIVAICAGAYHTLALDSSGNVWAWGINSSGQLGDGTTTQQNMAEELTTLGGISVQELAAGAYHSLMLTTSGTVEAWGLNSTGQVGDGTTTQRNSPVSVSGLSGVTITALAGGEGQSLALESGGTVWAWGDNIYGDVGDGTLTQRRSPVHLSSLSNVTALAANSYGSFVVEGDGSAWAFGANTYGELGSGTVVNQVNPVQMQGVSAAVAITTCQEHTVILRNDGTTWACGFNYYSSSGNGYTPLYSSPLQVLTSSTYSAISNNGNHELLLGAGGTVWGVGDNNHGDLGDGTILERGTPVQTSGLSGITAVSAGFLHSLALRSDGTVWAWGSNQGTQLGNGGYVDEYNPVQAGASTAGFTDLTAIFAGYSESYAIKNGGTLWAWGDNSHGELGDGTTTERSSPEQVSSLSGITAVSTGLYHYVIALKSDGTVWTWGDNSNGQLGNGTTTDCYTPQQVTALAGVTIVAIQAGNSFSTALDSSGNVWAWGINTNGWLGDGTTTQHNSPEELSTISGVTELGGHLSQVTIAWKNDGTLWGWGLNSDGELGLGNTTEYNSPVQLTNFAGITSAVGGQSQTLLLKQDGHVEGEGNDCFGALGSCAYATPFVVPGFNALATVPTPTVSITTPSNNATANMEATQTFTASASETGGTIASVSYYVNSNLIGTSTSGSSYSVSWTPTTWGSYIFNAIATDTNGQTSYRSSPITIQVPYGSTAGSPTFSPVAGTYTAAQNVTVSSSAYHSTIYYTTDGSTPTTSSSSFPSGGTIAVTQSETLKAIAVGIGYANSAVASAAYSIQPPASAPTFNPAPGTYASSQTVMLSSATSEATIYYTLDGTTPTTSSSSVYSGGTITVSQSETINAMAVATDYNNSAGASAVYVIQSSAASPTFSLAAGTYGSPQTVTLSSATAGATIYYTTDGSTPTTSSSSIASGETIAVSQSETVNAVAIETDNSSVTASASYVIQTPAATPTLSPAASTYTSAQTVTLTSTTAGATIYYTTDGSTPTTTSSSVASGGTITVSANETVTAIAGAPGFDESTICAVRYVFTSQSSPTATGLELWLKADAGATKDGSGNVSAWADQTGNYPVTQSSSANDPTYVASDINGKPALNFNGSQWLYNSSSMGAAVNSDITMITVATTTGNSGMQESLMLGNRSGNYTNRALGYYQSRDVFDIVNAFYLGAAAPPASTYVAQELTVNSSLTTATFYRNGIQTASLSISGLANISSGVEVGSPLGNVPWQGRIAEVLVYNHQLTSTELAQTDGYLADKYGFASPNATWPTAYNPGVQALITTNQWNKAQADAYVAFAATNPPVPPAGLSLWFKADAKVTADSSGNVSQWQDQSSNQFVAQSTFSSKPILVPDAVNGKPALSFSDEPTLTGTQTIADTASQGVTLITVASNIFSYGYQFLLSLGEPGNGQMRTMGYVNGAQVFGNCDNQATIDSALTSGAYVEDASTLATDGTSVAFFRNGGQTGTSSITSTADITPGFCIGGGTVGYPWSGDIAEVLVYNRPLNSAELEQVAVYLAVKYNLLLNVPAPTITPDGGAFTGTTSVSFSSVPSPAIICYTLDGTIPTASSAEYTNSFTLGQSCPVTAAIFLNNVEISPIASTQFNVGDNGNIGISDAWQTTYFGHTGINPSALSPGGSGLTNLQAYLFGYNPTMYSTNGDGLSDLVNYQLGYGASDIDINGYGLTNAQQLALGLDPFDLGVNPSWPTPPALNPSDHTAPVITLSTPQAATLSP